MPEVTNNFNAPIFNYGTIEGNIINPVYNDCGKPREKDGGSSGGMWKQMQTDEAKAVWGKLVDAGYCHVQEAGYIWDATQAEYGYMVRIVSDILHLRNPSSNRLQWKAFHCLFYNAPEIEPAAKAKVSENVNSMGDNARSWCEAAKKIKRLLE